MSKLIITTVGASVISNKHKLYPEEFEPNIQELKDSGLPLDERIKSAVIDGTVKKLKNNLRNKLSSEYLSAEIASLRVFKNNEELGISKDDVIALLSTDTEEGKLCATINKKVLDEEGWCQNVPDPIVIEGLRTRKVNDDENISEIFKNAGLNKLKDKVEKLLKSPNFNVTHNYFNITGGFKAVIPFATIIAFEKGMSLMYLYEESDDLILIEPPKEFKCSYKEIIQNTHTRQRLGW